jgi:two-component system phosphate regulon sensor histidine kinase PhoR
VLQTGIPKQLRALEWGQSRVDLSRRFFTLSVSPLKRPKSEEVYGALGVFHDISELKLAEQMRIDFVGNVSHELRTPLSSIRGYAETMLEDLEQRATTEAQFARTIVRNVERLIELVTDLLDLSSLDAGVEKLHREWLPARELVGPVFEQFRPRMKERKLELVLEGKDVRVFSDRKRMEQVLVNLIDNASKFSPEQGRITVSFEDRPFEVILSVRDQGVGIPPESLPRVFERFYRVDSGRSRHQGGTGLGLAIVKHIVQRHGGNVRVESDLSRGSVFFCRIPKA